MNEGPNNLRINNNASTYKSLNNNQELNASQLEQSFSSNYNNDRIQMNTTIQEEKNGFNNISNKSQKNRKIPLLFLALAIILIIAIGIVILKNNLSNTNNNNKSAKLRGSLYLAVRTRKEQLLLKTNDGEKWESISLPSGTYLNSISVNFSDVYIDGISYVNNKYILYARADKYSWSDTIIYVSDDGIEWSFWEPDVESFDIPLGWRKIEYVNGKYYVISHAGANRSLYMGESLTSLKDITSIYFYDHSINYLNDYVFANGKILLSIVEKPVEYWEQDRFYLFDGKDESNWKEIEVENEFKQLVFANGIYLAYATNTGGSTKNNGVYMSKDAITWKKVLDVQSFSYFDFSGTIIYENNNFYAVDSKGVYYSSDGENWEEFYKTEENQYISEFTCKNGIYVLRVYNDDKYKILLSKDGISWKEKDLTTIIKSVANSSSEEDINKLEGMIMYIAE